MNLPQIHRNTLDGLVLQLQSWWAYLTVTLDKEHSSEGYHKIPSFTDVDQVSASMFIGTASQTFVVAVANVEVLKFSKSPAGDAVTLVFEFTGTVGGTPAPAVSVRLPYGWVSKSLTRNLIRLSDGGTVVVGQAVVTKNGTTVDVYRMDEANLAGGTTGIRGQITFQVKTARVT